MTDFSIHRCKDIRTTLHMPHNANAITLTVTHKIGCDDVVSSSSITLYELPTEVTDILLEHFGNPNEMEAKAAALLRQLEAALSGLVGLTQLLSHRDDLPAEVRNLLATSHRVIAAESAIKAAAAEGEQS